MTEKVQYHAWVSATSDSRTGSVYYEDEDGKEIRCSFVGRSDTDHGTGFTDVKYICPVFKFIRSEKQVTGFDSELITYRG